MRVFDIEHETDVGQFLFALLRTTWCSTSTSIGVMSLTPAAPCSASSSAKRRARRGSS